MLDEVKALELWVLRPGPDGLTKILRCDRPGIVAEGFVVESDLAEVTVLALWGEWHREATGYPPPWASPVEKISV